MEFNITKRDGTMIPIQIDEEDSDLAGLAWSMAGGKGKTGKYAARREGKGSVYLHRVIAQRMGLIEDITPVLGARGRWTISIDHINGDKLDNRRSNLRLADRRQQMTNPADGPMKRNTSGVTGVSWTQATRKWYASISIEGRTVSLGLFDSIEEAAEARRAAEVSPPSPPPRHTLQPCGTPAAWQRHRLRGETPCDVCRAAWNADCRARQARARARR